MAKGAPKYSATVRGEVLVIAFNDQAGTRLEVDTAKYNPRQTVQSKLHGTKQKVVDSMAGKNLADSITQARRVVDGLRRGGWGMIGLDIEALVEAIVSVTGLEEADVRERVDAADEAKMEEWANNAKIAAIMAEIEAKRKKAEAASGAEFTFN